MEQFVNSLLDNCNLPVLTAFLLGILTSVSPCTFTTNVMVLGYIGRDMSGGRRVFANGLFYTLGRIVSYTVLGLICIPVLKKGASTFFVQSLVSDYGGYILAPTLIVYGVFLLLGSKFPFGKFGFRASESSKRLRGSFGAFVLGLLFALAFCPISGVFYFGMLLPMAALEPGGYLYPVVFAVASGILVVLIAWIVAFGMSSLGRFYNRVNQFQKWLNLIVAVAFIFGRDLLFCDLLHLMYRDEKIGIDERAVFRPKEKIEYAEGSIVSQEFIHNRAGNLTLFSFDEGQQLSEHTAPFDAVCQDMDGRGRKFTSQRTFIVLRRVRCSSCRQTYPIRYMREGIQDAAYYDQGINLYSCALFCPCRTGKGVFIQTAK